MSSAVMQPDRHPPNCPGPHRGRTGRFFPSLLKPRRRADLALRGVIMTAHTTGTSEAWEAWSNSGWTQAPAVVLDDFQRIDSRPARPLEVGSIPLHQRSGCEARPPLDAMKLEPVGSMPRGLRFD